MFGCNLLHELDCGTLRYALREVVPPNILLRAEIRPVKQFLQTKDFDFLARRLLDQLEVLVDHCLLDFGQWVIGTQCITSLDEPTAHDAGHESTSERGQYTRPSACENQIRLEEENGLRHLGA